MSTTDPLVAYIWGRVIETEATRYAAQVREALRAIGAIVLDPEDANDREWFRQMAINYTEGDWTTRDCLRSRIAPPKPAEPTGLGAVVEDAEGRRWVRHSNTPGSFPWIAEGRGAEGWSNITAVRTLSPGVKA